MFEDIIRNPITEKKSGGLEKEQNICPFCGTDRVELVGNIEMDIDDSWTSEAICKACGHTWTIVYNEDMSVSHTKKD